MPFEWRQPAVATPNALAAYAGEYYSEELDARYRVTATDSVDDGLAQRTLQTLIHCSNA